MIVCPRCTKENQDHYKFCLGCGAELPRDAAQQPKSFTAPTPPSGMPAAAGPAAPPGEPQFGGAAAGGAPSFGGAPVSSGGGGGAAAGGAAAAGAVPAAAPAAAVPAASGPAPAGGGDVLSCPQCGSSVPPNFKFCGGCGHPMDGMAGAAEAAPAPAPAPAAAPSPAAAAAARGNLVLIRPDGTEGDTFPLADGETTLGRETGGMFASDTFLSPKHATFSFQGNDLEVRDEGSLNGIYLRIDREVPVEIADQSVFRIGQEILRFESLAPAESPGGVEVMGSPNPGYLGRVVLVIGRDTHGNAYCVPPEGMHLGRERGDVIFPDDGYVSGLHCRIHGEGGKVFLTDVGSSNGSFLRVLGQTAVKSGSLLLLGQQLFRVEY